ncbi:MAG: leucine-rich repeat domain-containing protein [Butyrivibrio sp.]|nr:leucine-rich repeat domain-containing protein [Butyrivibrio sp.]
MKKPMKLLSILTSASLAMSGLSAMAIPMTAYAALVAENPFSIIEASGDEADTSMTIEEGYETLNPISLTVTENFDTATDTWIAVTKLGVTKDGEDLGEDGFVWTCEGSEDAENTTKTSAATLGIPVGLTEGEYVVTVGNTEPTISATYTVTVTAASGGGEEPTYDAEITPDTFTLNKTTTSKTFTVSATEESDAFPEAATYKWELTAGATGAFDLSTGAGTAAADNDSVEISVSEDAEQIFAEAVADAEEAKTEVPTFLQATLTATVAIVGQEDIVKTATVKYVPEEEEEPSEEPSKPQDEEKKDETKKDDTSKAPAPAGTEIKGEQATYKVTGTGEAEYEAPKDAAASTVAIPDEIKDANGNVYKVTSVAPNAFKNNKKITKAVIGKNVTTIGANAFSGCKKLKNLELDGNVVKTIGKNAFKGTKKGLKVKIFAKNKKTAQKLFKKVVKTGKAKEATLKFKKRAVKK